MRNLLFVSSIPYPLSPNMATTPRKPRAVRQPTSAQSSLLQVQPVPEPTVAAPEPQGGGPQLSVVLERLCAHLEATSSGSRLGWGVRSRRTYYVGLPSKGEGGPLYAWDADAGVATPAPGSGFTARLVDAQRETTTSATFGDKDKLVLDFDLGADAIRLRLGFETACATALLRGLAGAALLEQLQGELSISFRFGDHDSGKVVLASVYANGTWVDPRLCVQLTNSAEVMPDAETSLAFVQACLGVTQKETDQSIPY